MAKSKQKNTAWKILIGILLIAVVFLISRFTYEWWMERKARFVRYDAFGIDIPTQYSIHGIDVSKYQEIINWESVQAMNVEGIKLGFAFIKATEGILNKDRHFNRNWKKSQGGGCRSWSLSFLHPEQERPVAGGEFYFESGT